MGTGKGGRYLNTKGSGRSVSDHTLVHSSKGTFTYTPKGHHISKLKSGDHGQAGMDLLRKAGISFNILRTYNNGVRVGVMRTHGKIATVFPRFRPIKSTEKKEVIFMSISNDFNILIQKRKAIEGDVDYDNNPVIKGMISLMTKDVRQVVDFIMNDCSEEQFIQLSEILDEIIEKTKSPEIIDALRMVAK